MKRVIFSMIGLLALATTASAADLPRRYNPVPQRAPAPAYVPISNWTGFYIGINGGGGWGTSTWDSTGSFDVSGAMVGGTIGYNWQHQQWVFGAEGDIDWTNISGSTNAFCTLGCETKNSWLATVRGRVGLSFDRFLPYITGGLAVGNIHASTPGFAGAKDTNIGWTAGGGLEFIIAGNWSAKAEYLYVDLGKFNCGFACGAAASDNVSFNTHLVRGGVNLRF
jgi:outer membrane immunogenic protein